MLPVVQLVLPVVQLVLPDILQLSVVCAHVCADNLKPACICHKQFIQQQHCRLHLPQTISTAAALAAARQQHWQQHSLFDLSMNLCRSIREAK